MGCVGSGYRRGVPTVASVLIVYKYNNIKILYKRSYNIQYLK